MCGMSYWPHPHFVSPPTASACIMQPYTSMVSY